MKASTIGVLVMAYGTPKSLDEVEAYYTHIRHGRRPTPELLQNLIDRYQAIGGVSPLNEITYAQAEGIQAHLNQIHPGQFKVYLGMKHTAPFIEDVVSHMAEDGIENAITLVLAPHYSTLSVQVYQTEADNASRELGKPTFHHVNNWHLEPVLISILSDYVHSALNKFPHPEQVKVLFSAHSLPERILAMNDPYAEQLQQTGRAVAEQLGLSNYSFAWQSAGRTQEKWLGPDILDVLKQLHEEGQNEVVLCPAGFVSDHLEVLYDVDIECQGVAKDLGMHLERTTSLNTDARFLEMLSQVVLRHASTLLGTRK